MSFSTQPTVYSLEDDSDLFVQGYVDPGNDFFDEYLNFDPESECSTFPIHSESTGQVKSISDSPSASTSCSPQDLHLKDNTSNLSSREPWTILPTEAFNRNKPLRGNNVYSADSGRGSISDTELLSLEGIHLRSPQNHSISPSLPVSPTKSPGGTLRRTKRFIRSFSKSFAPPQSLRESDCRQRSPIRKSTVPAKMMRASQYNEQNLEEWQRLAADASKFNFGFSQPSIPLSPPPSARVSDSSDHGNGIVATVEEAFNWDHPVQQYAARLHTPLTTPIPDDHGFHNQNLQHVSTNNIIFSSSDDQSSNMWIQPSAPTDFSNFDLQASYLDESDSSSIWWSQPTTTPIIQPAPAVFHRTPQRNTKSLAMQQLQSELAYNATELALSPSSLPSGLMIQMPHSPNPQSFVVSSPMHQNPHRHQQQQGYFSTHPQSCQSLTNPRHRYTQSQPIPPAQQFPQSTMRKSRSRGDLSESPSPTNCLSPGQVPLTPRSASFHVAKRRSASRKHSEASLPKVKASGNGIDFVNFTPHDSMKILTGVAPSGSSKTKARREKEAMDKRRRLSQAAVRAVQAAGGSIESLVEEGLFV